MTYTAVLAGFVAGGLSMLAIGTTYMLLLSPVIIYKSFKGKSY